MARGGQKGNNIVSGLLSTVWHPLALLALARKAKLKLRCEKFEEFLMSLKELLLRQWDRGMLCALEIH